MSVTVEVLTAIDQVGAAAYETLRRSSQATAFYDPRFLAGVERSPLMPIDKVFYLAAYEGPALVGFLPAYLQPAAEVDPFGVLARATSARFRPGARGLFSHVIHCCDSTILSSGGELVFGVLLERLATLARAEGAQHFAIMNVAQGPLLAVAQTLGLEVGYMFDRFFMDLSRTSDFDALLKGLPKDGRQEMRRQLRKFASADNARVIVEAAPFSGLDELTTLCHLTTKRRGTPQYLPPAPLAELVRSCGDMIRLVMTYVGDRIVGGFICVDDGPVLHLWLGGVTYDGLDFSPYTVGVAEAYRYALAQGKRRIEAGRLNARIKQRLGLSPLPLSAIVSPDLLPTTGPSR